MDISAEIRRLAKAKNAIIMAHYYEPAEVQDVADIIGDSLALAQQAAKTTADIIVLCGVHFMAETAAILCPTKRVLSPDVTAGCSLADSCSAADLRRWRDAHPDYQVISYVNTSAAVKALSDIVVTSSNALKIVNRFPEDAKLLFGPDYNLGSYINQQTGRHMELWSGCCHVHSRFSVHALQQLKAQYPAAKVLAHPECKADVLALSDVIGSTQALLHYVQLHPQEKQYIIATECGVIHKMQQSCPEAMCIPVPATSINPQPNVCEYMRQITLEKLYTCLRDEMGLVTVDAETATKALIPIQKMLEWSK